MVGSGVFVDAMMERRARSPGVGLAETVITERQRRRWTQQELARRAGLLRDSVSDIEAGRVRLRGFLLSLVDGRVRTRGCRGHAVGAALNGELLASGSGHREQGEPAAASPGDPPGMITAGKAASSERRRTFAQVQRPSRTGWRGSRRRSTRGSAPSSAPSGTRCRPFGVVAGRAWATLFRMSGSCAYSAARC